MRNREHCSMLILMTYQAASQFEANFDDRAGGNYTISYFVGEPVLYHPGKVTDHGSSFAKNSKCSSHCRLLPSVVVMG